MAFSYTVERVQVKVETRESLFCRFIHCVENLYCCILAKFPGDKLQLKSNADGEDKDPTKNYKTPNSRSFERHKDIPCKFCHMMTSQVV